MYIDDIYIYDFVDIVDIVDVIAISDNTVMGDIDIYYSRY
jgi:hypothetical protein